MNQNLACLPDNGADFMYAVQFQIAFQLDRDILDRLINNIPAFIPAEWLTGAVRGVSHDISRISGPFTGMNYDAASVQAKIVAAEAVRLYNPGGGDLKRLLDKSLWWLCSLYLAACSAKGWDGFGAYLAWDRLFSNSFNQFLEPDIAQAARSTWTADVNFIDDMKVVFANNVMSVARWCFMALSLINRTQAIIWLHENGYPLIYEIQGLTRYVFEKAIASGQNGQNGQNSEAASASANRPDQVVAEDESKPAKTEADLNQELTARSKAEKAAKGKKTDKATMARMKNNAKAWKTALAWMIPAAVAVAKDGAKARTRKELQPFAEKAGGPATPDAYFETWRAALPDDLCDKKNRAGRSQIDD
ncbi:MAG: hypothetical protein LBP33_06620 [Candidatus Adiutrix sp.]|jgi:hypothetical protein|nr:hypothetical protein [Candidatus Adiutrix sp.]